MSTFRYASLTSHVWETLIALATFAPVAGIAVAATHGAARFGVVGACAICAVGAGRRAFRLEVIATREDIYIRNFWRTYRVPWSEVDAIGMGSVMALPAAAVVLRGGQVRCIQTSSYTGAARLLVLSGLRRMAPVGVAFREPHPAYGLGDDVS
jgi:hypothetical protein